MRKKEKRENLYETQSDIDFLLKVVMNQNLTPGLSGIFKKMVATSSRCAPNLGLPALSVMRAMRSIEDKQSDFTV